MDFYNNSIVSAALHSVAQTFAAVCSRSCAMLPGILKILLQLQNDYS